MLRLTVGVFFLLHGLVHLLWFVVPWRITTVDGLPYATTVLLNRVNLGETGIRIVGLLWLLATLGWVVAGIGVIILASWWQALTLAVALFSLLLCILGLPVTKYGLLINLAILALFCLNGRFQWLSGG